MLLIKGLVDEDVAKTTLHNCQRTLKSLNVNGKISQFHNHKGFHEELLQFSPLKLILIANVGKIFVTNIEPGTIVVFATLNLY